MEIVDFLEDISNMTKEEMEKRNILAPLDSNGHVKLTENYWTEVDGIRYLKRSLIINFAHWCLYTLDCISLVSKLFASYTLCILAFSTSDATTDQLGNAYSEDTL